MKNKGKMIIILVLIVILIIVTINLTKKLISIMNSREPDNIMVRIDNTIENHLENNVQENNTVNKIEENTIGNTVENDVSNENNNTATQNVNAVNNDNNNSTVREQEVDKETIEEEENSQEKAINIVKDDWGEDSTAYFSYEGKDNGKHTVYVRDNETTRVLRIYTIDTSNGTFTVQ